MGVAQDYKDVMKMKMKTENERGIKKEVRKKRGVRLNKKQSKAL